MDNITDNNTSLRNMGNVNNKGNVNDNDTSLRNMAIKLSFDLREILQNGNMVYVAGIEERATEKHTKYLILPEIYDEGYKSSDKILNQFISNKVKRLEYYVNEYTSNQKKHFANTLMELINKLKLENDEVKSVCNAINDSGGGAYISKTDINNLMYFLTRIFFKSSLVATNINFDTKPIILSHSLNRPQVIDDYYRIGMLLEDMLFDGTDLCIWYYLKENSTVLNNNYAFVFFLDTRKVKHFDDELRFIGTVFHENIDNFNLELPKIKNAR